MLDLIERKPKLMMTDQDAINFTIDDIYYLDARYNTMIRRWVYL
jgi:hypothetical protein